MPLSDGFLPFSGGVPTDAMHAGDEPSAPRQDLSASGYYPRLHLLPDGGSVSRVSELPSAAPSFFDPARRR
jgi:hypothetical protein